MWFACRKCGLSIHQLERNVITEEYLLGKQRECIFFGTSRAVVEHKYLFFFASLHDNSIAIPERVKFQLSKIVVKCVLNFRIVDASHTQDKFISWLLHNPSNEWPEFLDCQGLGDSFFHGFEVSISGTFNCQFNHVAFDAHI